MSRLLIADWRLLIENHYGNFFSHFRNAGSIENK